MKTPADWARNHFFGITTLAGAEELVRRIQDDASPAAAAERKLKEVSAMVTDSLTAKDDHSLLVKALATIDAAIESNRLARESLNKQSAELRTSEFALSTIKRSFTNRIKESLDSKAKAAPTK